jgi:hypothetical protein
MARDQPHAGVGMRKVSIVIVGFQNMRSASIAASGPCPTFFRALCRTASEGGSGGYEWAGHGLTGAIPQLMPEDVEHDEWYDLVQEFIGLVCPEGPSSGMSAWPAPDDEAVLAWLDRWLPRCMALVPRRRRDSFLKGVYYHGR